uniref:Putative membrane protein n=1 Tax=uncultured bacterium BLR7 TaxID=506523 RepID=C0INN8_9BACT|nr:putative membrane protein [uncultured bacterium BLR7]
MGFVPLLQPHHPGALRTLRISEETMRAIGLAGLGLLALASPAVAQDVKGMDTVACPKAVAAIATCYQTKIETGAYLLAAMPKSWNGNLVVFAHGGPSTEPPEADDNAGSLQRYNISVKLGYAWIATTYRKEGFGVAMAASDVEDARKFFVDHFPKPKRTLMHGASYGGLVGTKLLETYVKKNADGSMTYDGAFFNSGAVGGSVANYEFRADLRAVVQYYCMNLPKPDEAQYPIWQGLPTDSKLSLKQVADRIDECTGVAKKADMRNPEQQKRLTNILNVMRIPESMLVRHMQAATFVFRDINERLGKGKSAFSNIGVTYKGSDNDQALNSGVARFEADPAAVAALRADGVASGNILIPVVSIHSLNDPQAAVEHQAEYAAKVKAAGKSDLLVQNYTDENIHVGQSQPEMASSINALQAWIDKGTKPTPQSIAAACESLKTAEDNRCRWHSDYQPKPLNTRFARTAAN